MSWIKLDDKLHRHPKARESSDAAFKVWVLSWSYCGDMPTPTGYMSTAEAAGLIRGLGKPLSVVKELVERRMWDEVEGGYVVHEFEQGLPGKSTERVRAWRDKKKKERLQASPETVTQPLRGVSAHARAVPEPDPVPVPRNASKEATPVVRTTPADAVQNGLTDEPVTQLAVGMHELFGRALSGEELLACQAAVNQYAYMSADEFLRRARDHIKACQQHDPPLPVPRTVGGFSGTWREQNDWLADHGSPKAWRPAAKPSGMTSVGEALKNLTPGRAT